MPRKRTKSIKKKFSRFLCSPLRVSDLDGIFSFPPYMSDPPSYHCKPQSNIEMLKTCLPQCTHKRDFKQLLRLKNDVLKFFEEKNLAIWDKFL